MLHNENLMRTNLLVIDDFYNNVDSVREFALAQKFNIKGNYPGLRTKNFINESTKDQIQRVVHFDAGNITDWMDDDNHFTGSFQITNSSNRSWIHTDDPNNWAGVLYLTPDAPPSSGTGFYRSKINGSLYGKNHIEYGVNNKDKTYWELVNEVHNIYNRLILFRSDQWHAPMNYFGCDNETGRLTQVFFFTTEQ